MESGHDGAGSSRTEKVAYSGDVGAWACRSSGSVGRAEVEDGDCGQCEKCVRTRLNFRVAGSFAVLSAGGRWRGQVDRDCGQASLAGWGRPQSGPAGRSGEVVAASRSQGDLGQPGRWSPSTNAVIRRSRPLAHLTEVRGLHSSRPPGPPRDWTGLQRRPGIDRSAAVADRSAHRRRRCRIRPAPSTAALPSVLQQSDVGIPAGSRLRQHRVCEKAADPIPVSTCGPSFVGPD